MAILGIDDSELSMILLLSPRAHNLLYSCVQWGPQAFLIPWSVAGHRLRREAIYPSLSLLRPPATWIVAALHGLRVDRAHVGRSEEGGGRGGSGLYKISCCEERLFWAERGKGESNCSISCLPLFSPRLKRRREGGE